MYLEHFSLEKYPFHNSPDPEFYFNSLHHREALATMTYGIQEAKGFILISGGIGTGKTTLIQALNNELSPKDIVIQITNPWVTHSEILNTIKKHLGLSTTKKDDDAAAQTELKEKLIKVHAKGHKVIVIIDEAHQLSETTLEGIRLLSNLETTTTKLLQIVFLGQEELTTMLRQYSMRQLRQRFALSFHLEHLPESETLAYISHRLKVAGGAASIFDTDTTSLIHNQSRGIPRLINQICDGCMLIAYGKGSSTINTEILDEALSNLQMSLFQNDEEGEDSGAANTHSTPINEDFELPIIETSVAAEAEEPRAEEQAITENNSELPSILTSAVKKPAKKKEDNTKTPPLPTLKPAKKKQLAKIIIIIVCLIIGAGLIGLVYNNLSSNSPQTSTWESISASNDNANSTEIKQSSMISLEISPDWPLPYDATHSGTRTLAANLGTNQLISELIIERYGAWNESLQDVIYMTNPLISNLGNVQTGTRITLPILSRDKMVVQNQNGTYSVYYAAISDPALVKEKAAGLQSMWGKSFINQFDKNNQTYYRLFIGAFALESEALSVASSLWFEYFPSLNKES